MAVFAFVKVNSPLASAIKAFAEYFSWQAEVSDIKQPCPMGKVVIKVIEAGITDAQTMRYIEKVRSGRERPVLLFAPEPEPGPIAGMLREMPNLFFIASISNAEQFIANINIILSEIENNRRFFIDAECAEDSYHNCRYIDALNTAKRMLTSEFQPYLPHMIIGRTLFISGRIHPALHHGKKALAARPRSMPAASLVAAAYQKLGQSQIAEKYLIEFLPLAESSVLYMIQLGDVYFENGKIPEAKAVYKKANTLEPESVGTQQGLLAVSILEGDLRASKQILTGPLAHFDLGRFCNLRAIALTNNKQFKNAEKLYLNTVNLLSNDRNLYKLYFNLGLCMKKAGRIDKSINYFDICKRLAPTGFSRVSEQLKYLHSLSASHKF